MIDKLKQFCFEAIIEKNSELHKYLNIDMINISRTKNILFGHFQLNDSVTISKIIKVEIIDLYILLKEFFTKKVDIGKIDIVYEKPCFINFFLNVELLNYEIKNFFIGYKKKLKVKNTEKIILDYSGPNIAKEMHVGHLRSTIIGECLANLLKVVGHKIIKINHLGDWGSQFGMLINYLKIKYANQNIMNVVLTLKDLELYYKNAHDMFISNKDFKKQSGLTVVKLQNQEKSCIDFWKKITKISKKEYGKIYKLLDVKIKYKGESFYRFMLEHIVLMLDKKKILQDSDNAKCIYIEGFYNQKNEPLPVIVKKSDSGFNYATIEIATLYYRIKYHKPNKIIYITDIGQVDHFKMIFNIIETIKLKNNNTKLIHIGLGLMLNKDGKKIRTRSGKSEKLIDLIKKSIKITKIIIKQKAKINAKKEILNTAIKLGINTIKYADLSNKLEQNYIFDYEKMLKITGNTAAFLIYAYVRTIGVKNKIKNLNIKYKDNDLILNLENNVEIDLVLDLLQYNYIIKKSASNLNPNILTYYLYTLCEKFHLFFSTCQIIKSNYLFSRLLICEITKLVLELSFNILGLKKIRKM